MPTAPPRICARCQRLIKGRCETCYRKQQRATDAQRGTSTERGYTADWRELRVHAFIRDGWTCRECGWQPETVATYQRLGIPDPPPADAVLDELRQRHQAGMVHLQGDHIQPISKRPDLRLALSNIQTLCSACHSRKTARESGWMASTSTLTST